jgi:sugar (pentulose or hexulose) kinase
MVAPVEERDRSRAGTILFSAHVVPDIDIGEVSIFTTGSLLAWVKRTFYGNEGYEVINREAAQSEPGARGIFLIPFFSGAGCPHWNAEAKGAIHGLTLAHTRGDVARAVMEAVAFEVRTNIEVMEKRGISVEELRLDGGAAKSELWNQIFADVCRRRCLVSKDVEATARGAAILAAIGLGTYTFDSAVESFTPAFTEVMPKPEMVERYSKIYEKYQFLRDLALKIR